MANIIPGVPPTYNPDDLRGTVKNLCNYMRTFQENVDFILSQIKKDVDNVSEDVEDIKEVQEEHNMTIVSLCGSVSQLAEE